MESDSRQAAGRRRVPKSSAWPALRPARPGREWGMGRHSRIRDGLETEGRRGLGAVPRGEVAVVRRTRLHLDRRRELGLASLSLRPLDATAFARLDLDAGLAARIQTRRCVLAPRR